MNDHLKSSLIHDLQACAAQPLVSAGRALLATLGYRSERQLDLQPNTAAEFQAIFDPEATLDPNKALLGQWRSVDMLLQVTAAEIEAAAGQVSLFAGAEEWEQGNIQSYVFFAVDLQAQANGAAYTRTQLATATRAVNKLFGMPVMVIFRHGETLTFAIIARRRHKRDANKDVLEKVTLIKDIRCDRPHRAHLDILAELSLLRLVAQEGVGSFDDLQQAWEKTLDTTELNKKFYREVANWYFWATHNVTFPDGAEKNEAVRNATSVIRLITRLIFVWFLKEKGLVPPALFDKGDLQDALTWDDPQGSTYYKAILQNLFFATLNTHRDKDEADPKKHRRFRGQNEHGRDSHYGIHNVYRYRRYFRAAGDKEALALFAEIPFLNGGLFECLDRPQEHVRVDGFSDRDDNVLVVPDGLFFDLPHPVDLNADYGTRGVAYSVRGLLNIFGSYKFTVEENTPIEEEVALDPELLGKVFENLLAAYNPETGETARKQTGSFYTPRAIVDYMVDESLIASLAGTLAAPGQLRVDDALHTKLRGLLAYTAEPHDLTLAETQQVIAAIDNLKVIDPACGSGAFPMGVLQKLVFLLRKLDSHNAGWRQRQLDKAEEIPDSAAREAAIGAIEAVFRHNDNDYGRKLYLIENCIYGVDIQPIAVQIAKLRCFIALIVDQQEESDRPNRGILALPNLETKFVAADTLLQIDRQGQIGFRSPQVEHIEARLKEVRKSHFEARGQERKERCRQEDKRLRDELGELLQADGWPKATADQLAGWDPYNQNTHATFFDSEWMFGVRDGFDIVIGNPPYVRPHKLSANYKVKLWQAFRTFEKKADLYVCFIEKGMQFLRQRGQLAYIVSNGFLRLDSFEKLRTYLLSNSIIQQIIDFSDNVFESAAVKTCILLLSASKEDAQEVRVAVTNSAANLCSLELSTIPQQKFAANYKAIFDLSSQTNTDEVKDRIRKDSIAIDSVFDISFGLKTGDDEQFLTHDKANDSHRRLLRGENVDRYRINYQGEYVWYVPELMRRNRPTARPGTSERFEQPKVLVRDTGSGLRCTFDGDAYYAKDMLVVTHPSKSIPLLLKLTALLNSTLMRFYYETSFPTLHVQRNELASLPIKKELLDDSSCLDLANFAMEMLKAQREKDDARVQQVDAAIDRQVYQLYGLTEEEIQVVEGR
jgi:hypothetical protein